MNIETLLEITTIILEVLLFYVFVHSRLIERNSSSAGKLSQYAFLALHASIIYTCNFLGISSVITILLAFSMDTAFTFLFFNVSFFQSLFYGVAYSSICMIAEYITLLIPLMIGKVPVEHMLAGGILRFPISLTYIALIAVFVFLFAHLFNKNMHLTLIQKVSYVFLSVIGTSIAHYNLILILNFSQNSALEEELRHLVLANIFFLMMLLFLLVYIYLLGKSKEDNIRYLKQEKQHELEEQQFRILLTTTESLRAIKHDMKHHLSIVKSLAEHGETKQLQDYVNSYYQEIEKTNILLSTGNTAIDCLVSSKLSYAKQLNISVQYSIVIPSSFPMDDIALSSVIGNLLDNAIENSIRSMETTPNFTPWINFYIKPFQDMIVLHVENNYDGLLKKDAKQNILSTKKEPNHGIGLNRVSELVSQNNGIMTVSTERQIFSVHIILPQKEEY